jgi:hypothetical protein
MFAGYLRDLTERKQTEAALAQQFPEGDKTE